MTVRATCTCHQPHEDLEREEREWARLAKLAGVPAPTGVGYATAHFDWDLYYAMFPDDPYAP